MGPDRSPTHPRVAFGVQVQVLHCFQERFPGGKERNY